MAKDSITIPRNERAALREIGIRKTQKTFNTENRVIASPDVRRYVEEKGVKLEDISVRGDGQSITKLDVDRYIERLHIFEQMQLKHKQREIKQSIESISPENIFDHPVEKLEEENVQVDDDERIKVDFSEQVDQKNNETIISKNTLSDMVEDKEVVLENKQKDHTIENAIDPELDQNEKEKTDVIFSEESVEKEIESDHIVDAIEKLAEKIQAKHVVDEIEEHVSINHQFSELADENIFELDAKYNDNQDIQQINEPMQYDVIVIGCGMSGFETALYSAHAGLKTAVVEQDEIGGKTLKDGTFPMAYLRANAAFIGECGRAAKRGLLINEMSLDLQTMMRDKAKKILRYRDKMSHALKNLGVDFYNGTAEVKKDHSVSIYFDDEVKVELFGKAIVAATGTTYSIPERYSNISNIFTDGQAHDLERLPDEMVIIGSGISACEYASFYSILGTNVSIITSDDRLLPDFDEDIQKLVEDSLNAMKVEIFYRSEVQDVYRDSLGDLHIEIKEPASTTTVICTDCFVIRKKSPNVKAFDLCKPLCGPKGFIVDEKGQTTCDGIYAVGHVVGNNMKGASPSEIISAIKGESTNKRPEYSPVCINAFPQIAVVGLSEHDAKAMGRQIQVTKVLADKNMRLFMDDRAQGFIKLIADVESGKVLGAAICCENAFELVSFIQMTMSKGGTVDDCASVFFHHPSASSFIGEAALLM